MNAEDLKDLFRRWSALMVEQKEYLSEIDRIVGDADLGLTMSGGFLAAYDAIKDKEEPDLGKLVYYAGKAMASAVPSTMGTLIAKGLMSAGKSLRGLEELSDKDIVAKSGKRTSQYLPVCLSRFCLLQKGIALSLLFFHLSYLLHSL